MLSLCKGALHNCYCVVSKPEYLSTINIADMISSVAHSFWNFTMPNYAAKYFELGIPYFKNGYGEESEEYNSNLFNIATSYFYAKDYDQAILYGEKCLYNAIANSRPSQNIGLLYSQFSEFYTQNSQFEKAKEYIEKALLYLKDIDEDEVYYTALSRRGILNKYSEKYPDAIEDFQKVANFRKNVLGDNSQEYAKCLVNLGTTYFDSGDTLKAIETYKTSLEIYQKCLTGNKDPWVRNAYVNILLKMADINEDIDDDFSANCAFRAISILENYNQTNTEDYLHAISSYANAMYYLSKFNYAKKYYQQTLSLLNDSVDKALCLVRIANCETEMGNNKKAILYTLKAVELWEQIYGKTHYRYIQALGNLCESYIAIDDMSNAKKINKDIISLLERDVEIERDLEKEDQLVEAYIRQIKLEYKGNSLEHVDSLINVASIKFEILGSKTKDNNVAILFQKCRVLTDMADYKHSYQLQKELLPMISSQDKLYLTVQRFLVHNLIGLDRKEEALTVQRNIIDYLKSTIGEKSIVYANELQFYADILCKNNNISEAENTLVQTVNIYDVYDIELSGNKNYKQAIKDLAYIKQLKGDFESADSLSKIVKQYEEYDLGDIYTTFILSEDSVSKINAYHKLLDVIDTVVVDNCTRIQILDKLARYSYYERSDSAVTHRLCQLELLLLNEDLRNLSFYPEYVKNYYAERYKRIVFGSLPRLVYFMQDDTIIQSMCDAVLYCKSMELSYRLSLDAIREQTTNMELKQIIDDYKKLINEYGQNFSYENHILKVSLENKIHKLIGNKEDINTTIIRKNLPTVFDWAVEFTESNDDDGKFYFAFYITSMVEYPFMMPICYDEDITKYKMSGDIQSASLYNKIWEVADIYKKTNNFYVSPIGDLCTVPFEYLCDESGIPIRDKHNIYRLTSTKELVLRKNTRKKNDSATLFGGIDYNSTGKISCRHTNSKIKNNFSVATDSTLMRNFRGGAMYLPHTLLEVNNIDSILKRENIISNMYIGELGTESAFKGISGNSPELLHISTHGYYWEKDTDLPDYLKDQWAREDYDITQEDRALTRSGLLFAGANNILTGKAIPENTEDGILTAKELSMMDLSATNLVVLSACDTGLGDITSEGVFGLQRGFKLAGVNSILMSLWKVDDFATRLIMEEFYKNYVLGKSKNKSLKLAQNKLIEYTEDGENIYANPIYWASFVLLDTLYSEDD